MTPVLFKCDNLLILLRKQNYALAMVFVSCQSLALKSSNNWYHTSPVPIEKGKCEKNTTVINN